MHFELHRQYLYHCKPSQLASVPRDPLRTTSRMPNWRKAVRRIQSSPMRAGKRVPDRSSYTALEDVKRQSGEAPADYSQLSSAHGNLARISVGATAMSTTLRRKRREARSGPHPRWGWLSGGRPRSGCPPYARPGSRCPEDIHRFRPDDWHQKPALHILFRPFFSHKFRQSAP